jgi:DNA-binding transcriptional ArsR family regulator
MAVNMEVSMELHPTLWRTCRALQGATRLQLLRLVVAAPGLTVSDLAEKTRISCSRASQELRRLQARGLIRRVAQKGRYVQYLPESDPQVPSAKPILIALKNTFQRLPPGADPLTRRTAAALAHPHRVAILQELLNGPRNSHALQAVLHIPQRTLYRHLRILQRGQMVGTSRMVFRPARNPLPLAKCLVDLLRNHAAIPAP